MSTLLLSGVAAGCKILWLLVKGWTPQAFCLLTSSRSEKVFIYFKFQARLLANLLNGARRDKGWQKWWNEDKCCDPLSHFALVNEMEHRLSRSHTLVLAMWGKLQAYVCAIG